MNSKIKARPKTIKKTATVKRAANSSSRISPRTVLLAGVGAASMGRREAVKTYNDAVNNVVALPATIRKQTQFMLNDIERKTSKIKRDATARLTPITREIKRLRSQAQALGSDAQTAVYKVVAPVLNRVGIVIDSPSSTKRRGTPSVKTTGKKVVKKVRKTRKAA